MTSFRHHSASADDLQAKALSDLRIKRALVLQGGGAKGAFAFGCLGCLKDAGVQFDCVAGTSVGALNAALFSSDSLRLGQDLWSTLSEETTFRPYVPLARLFPRLLRHVILGVWIILHYFIAIRKGFRPLNVPYKWLFPLITVYYVELGYFYFSFMWAIWAAPSYILPYVVAVVGVLLFRYPTVFGDYLFPHPQSEASHLLQSSVLLAIGVLWFTLSLGLEAGVAYFWLMLAWLIGLCLLAITERMSIRSPAPLKQLIYDVLRNGVGIPTFVTVSFPAAVRRRGSPSVYCCYLPAYAHLHHQINLETAVENLLASASLPLGIVPPVVTDESSFVDGGLSDNIPLYPVMRYSEPDEIWVVLVDMAFCGGFGKLSGTDPDAFIERSLWEHWSKIDRQMRLQEMGLAGPAKWPLPLAFSTAFFSGTKAEAALDIGLRNPQKKPRLILIYPETTLGGFLDGTLRFEAAYAEDLIGRGRKAARNRLRELCII
jgi:predicted acylesterase/phospholipase RssA